MVQMMKRKKKGRRSKSDLEAAERELRRSGRRRNVTYNFDYDDDDEDGDYFFVDQDHDHNRKEKKLKLLLNLHQHQEAEDTDNDEDPENDEEYDDYHNTRYDDEDVEDVLEIKKGKKLEVITEVDSAPGTPTEQPSGYPLPDKKILVLILDKLQKKDIYGVFAEPVDPEELPDYHEIIEHPMDFSTIRTRLANGSYATLEQLESDVSLLCSNAMQYNEVDTIYHKQARSIQEMAKKKFQKLRVGSGCSKNQMKLIPKQKSASLSDNQIKKQISQTVQEPVGSDFTSGATLATAGDFQNGSHAVQVNGIRRATSSDGLEERNPPVIDTNLDKVEESFSGKSSLTRFGRKLPLHDEDRRATYNIASQPETISESVLFTFDEESKQLIPVGLHIDHAYASSLARFAGSLGPVAWRIASQRIEQILLPGTKFGHGWVGEYEPLSTPYLVLENYNIKEPDFFSMPHHTNTSKGNIPKTSITSKSNAISPSSNAESEYPTPKELKTTTKCNTSNASKEFVGGSKLKRKSSLNCVPVTNTFASSNPHLQNQTSASSSPHLPRRTSRMRKLHEHDKKALEQVELNGPPKALEQVELNGPPSTNHSSAHIAVERQVSNGSEASTPRSVELVSVNRNFLHSGSFKQRKVSGVADDVVSNNATLPKGKLAGNGDGGRGLGSCSDVEKVRTLFHHGQEQGLSDPVQQMRMLTEKSSIHKKSATQCTQSGSLIPAPAQTMSREDSSSIATAASARAWMSIGAGGFRPVVENMGPPIHISAMNSNQQPHVSQFRGNFPVHLMQFQQTTSPFHAFAPQAVRVGNTAQIQNRQMSLPQFLTTDMSRIQVQEPWRGLMPYGQQPQNQETSPPDLNVSFPSPGSPAKPLSRVPVDSQQPDLALQL